MIKKIILIILGTFLSLLILECGLRLAGFTISSYQQYKNNKALKNKSNYTIMCLGESTTHGQYPTQLQKILNSKHFNKFSIIDCGLSGTNLETILDLLDNNIQKYKPNIAICMLGINNGLTLVEQETSSNKYINKKTKISLKIFKLFTLLKKHLTSMTNNNILLANTNSRNENIALLVENATKLYYTKKYIESEKIAKQVLAIDPLNEKILYLLSTLYFYHLNNIQEAYKYSLIALNNNISLHRPMFYIVVFSYCIKNNINCNNLMEDIINDKFDINFIDKLLDLYRLIKPYLTEQQLQIYQNKILKSNNFQYPFQAINCIELKKFKDSVQYFDKAEELRLMYPNLETYKIYKLIIKKLIDNNIKVICMQYPVRSIKSLQEQLKNEPYYDKLTFISNEQNFKEALMKYNYNEIFTDQFAGDFGHCTDLGNTMIAENIVETLDKLTN